MLLVTTDTIAGKNITKHLGIVRGSSVRAKWFGKDIIAGLRHIVGGELTEYGDLLNEARDKAVERMIQSAEKIHADAIINVRFTTAAISGQAAEILVYGTAVNTAEEQ